jgi:hypothetical protein
MFTETFFVGLYSALMGFVLAITAQCYRSKCKEVSFCCIKIIRDTTAEEELDFQQQQRSQNPISSQSLDRPNERQL